MGGYAGVSNWWLNVWTTFDSVYLLEIARDGYRPLTAAFFPLMPVLLRPFGANENIAALTAISMSNVSFLVSLWIFHRLSAESFGEGVARSSVAVLAFFPTSVFAMAAYTDALFLMLVLVSFREARAERWWVASAAGFLAGLTRTTGPVLAVALLCDAVLRSTRMPKPVRLSVAALACAAAPLVAFLGVQLYFHQRFGAVTLLAAQADFGRAASFPWIPIWRDLSDLGDGIRHGMFYFVTFMNVLASLLVFVFAWRYRTRVPAAELLLMCGVMLMQLTYARTFPPYTISSLRYVFSTPAFASCLALALQSRSSDIVRHGMIVVGLLVSGGVAFLFGAKEFVS
ncbi:MAG: hypothetical protein V4813_00155 [Gemmatimonadota bacterium]